MAEAEKQEIEDDPVTTSSAASEPISDRDHIHLNIVSGRSSPRSLLSAGGFVLPSPGSSQEIGLLCDEDEDIITYEEEQLASSAFPTFEEIRRQGKLCDVTLVVGEYRFSAHRVVLAGTIPYFKAMFTSDMLESQRTEIEMHGFESETLEQLINYAYSGKLRISTVNVQSLMVGASFLQLNNIVDACAQYLKPRLQGSNVLTVRQFASALGCEILVRTADRFIQKHFISVAKTDDFLTLSVQDLVSILSRDQLFVSSEEQVFEGALRWVRHDPESRREHLSLILSCVRLPLLKPQFLTDRVAADDLIRSCLKCRDLLDEAKDYHLMPERRPLLHTFRTKPRFCTDIPGIVYAVGGLTNAGDSLSTVEMYDPMVAKWHVIEPMMTLRSRVGVAVMHGLLYAIGGFNGHERLRTVEVFNPETRQWKEVTPLNNKRSALGAAVVADRLYVCGGYDGITSLATVECYNSEQNKWHIVSAMTKQRSAAGIAVLDGKIYVMGGHDGMSIFNSVECFDPEIDKWTSITPMLNRRCRLGAAALNGKLYAAGGYDGGQFLRTAECYDPTMDKWTAVPQMNVKRSRVSLVANCGKLFAIGGYDGISNLSSMEVFTGEDNCWKFGASMVAHEGGVGIGVVPIIPKTDIS